MLLSYLIKKKSYVQPDYYLRLIIAVVRYSMVKTHQVTMNPLSSVIPV